ncbi:MAG: 2-amino-4-hydroxy-6-hydroxymethyldihydropteridine diphosphokinase [Clostridia bacterium]|nr:2-amino-4-hydroxy-6-hydroxymethyldihydropteridine diphosphokinase [Clostridia bacterium]
MVDKVILKDFEVLACHGVNPEEKVNKQPFVFTAELSVDFSGAAKDDDLNKTVSYASVKKEIKAFCEDNCFDLIETLASRLAVRILKKFPLAREIDLTVKKPNAPMSGKFDYAGVSVHRAWHKVYLALGSSEGDRNAYLDFAIERLKADDNFANIKESTRIGSEPYGGVAKGQFVNSVVECDTLYSARELLDVIHGIENDGGRVRKEHWGDRTLDIDIIFYDDEVIEDNDLCVPHADMCNRSFVLAPLAELCPNKVHPLLRKRVKELSNALNTK